MLQLNRRNKNSMNLNKKLNKSRRKQKKLYKNNNNSNRKIRSLIQQILALG